MDLIGNNHSLDEVDAVNAIIDGLPMELDSGRSSLYSNCHGKSRQEVTQIIRTHAYGLRFNDLIPRPPPRAAPARIPTEQNTRTRHPADSKVICWKCGETGHVKSNCTKWDPKDEPPAPGRAHDPSSELRISHNIMQTVDDSIGRCLEIER